MNLFQKTLARQNLGRPPVWFMRQAGRYHSHYQNLKKIYSFLELCKKPEVAAEVALGPIQDFDFDAAILFSDLLFPLEVMGMPLTYDPGPKLGYHLDSIGHVEHLDGKPEGIKALEFQAEAMHLTRKRLSPDKGLLGFVGGPLTLFFYSVAGTHDQSAAAAVENAIRDGRFKLFCEKLFDLLPQNMDLQAKAGADTVAMLDTCAGEIELETFKTHVVPVLKKFMTKFQELAPSTPITYYSKGTGPKHWQTLTELPIACLGIDWNHSLAEVLTKWHGRWAIQGNIDPNWLHLEPADLEGRLRDVFTEVANLPASHRQGWVCGLGHGVLQKTPEDNVRRFLDIQKEIFE